jgi:acetylglutamate kinase
MKKISKEPQFIHGYRVTDKETVEIVEMILGGLINKEIVQLINSHGGKAVGLTGKDANLLKTEKKYIKISNEEIDIGFVGEVKEVCAQVLEGLQDKGFIPVVAPVGFDEKGQTYNINADTVASAIAVALKAEKLIILTDVKGITAEDGSLLSTLNIDDALKLIEEDVITGGMIPKVYSCINALKGDVRKTHIIDGRIAHSLILEIFTKKGVGTEIIF